MGTTASDITFIVNGSRIALARKDVERKMKGVMPEPLRSLTVEVGGALYPVKQVFEVVTGLDRLDFTSATARRHLAKLGFRVSRAS